MSDEQGVKRCSRCEQGRPRAAFAGDKATRDGPRACCRGESIASRGGVCCVSLSAVPAHVDHCHETGRVRGVLCFSCNAALGQFKDQPDVMRRAAAYVEGNAWKPTLVAPGVYQLPS
ncbi:endonuclease domain-containing protein [Streptomyces achromogenes]|uniref:endonuclease domain-containing protein n=1 Tax=Streptomyces achromogenes TaxID=67255 RepID=UPI00386EE69D